MRMNTAPNIPKLNPNPTAFPIEKLRSRKSRSGRSGVGVRRSQSRNAARSTTPRLSEPATSKLPQPAAFPRTMPKTTARTPTPESTRPRRSSRTRAPKPFFSQPSANGIERTATGTLIQKIACQFQPWMTAPPTRGPTATPRPAMPPQMPMASGRRRSGTASVRSDSESGMIAAPPRPWIARATMSCVGSVLSAAPIDASVKTPMPMRKTVRRPKRSPSATAMRMNAANESV